MVKEEREREIDGREFVRKRMEELEDIYSERTIAIMQGLITGFSLFIIRLVLGSMGIVFQGIGKLVLLGILLVGVLTWIIRVFWRGKKFIGYYVLGGILSTLSGLIVAKEGWMLPAFILGVLLAYILTLIEWKRERKIAEEEVLSPSISTSH